ncbi:hypothetical protein F3Y22_tig00110733pilonHSYRG00003 [Hibiscus syriacus]|uniref:Uncharacterized protein n=1 Tax=Hibiscus syriacus TaxID=106335 RepID=A0A6A2ZTL2_HIBSY|nr:hypothetical protein F3Y22_tig00110733pilonHSYRG00003 [Hibiscus syriacus]
MDRSWMSRTNRFITQYQEGIRAFLNLAKQNTDSSDDYTQWTHHGESFQPNSDQQHDFNDNNHISEEVQQEHGAMFEMLDDIQKSAFIGINIESSSTNTEIDEPEGEVEKFRKLLNDAQRELYPGCKYSNSSFLMKMIHNKTITNSSVKYFDLNLKLFKDTLPKDETLPESYYQVKKLLRDLGMGYINIEACMNDCILYWKQYEHFDQCPNCQASRWKFGLGKHRKIARKIVKYFPLKPRLQRLFMSKDVAEDMRWHKEKRINDYVIRHPADATAWQEFDKENDWFALDSRSV